MGGGGLGIKGEASLNEMRKLNSVPRVSAVNVSYDVSPVHRWLRTAQCSTK